MTVGTSNGIELWRTAPPRLTKPSGQVDVWRVCLDLVQKPTNTLASVLAEDEMVRASRFHFDRDRARFIACRFALRDLLGSYLERQPSDIRFHYGENGKPEIADSQNGNGLRFSVAHSAGLALIAITSGCSVGIDLEKIQPQPELVQIARRFFSDREIKTLLASSEEKRLRAFFACWTRKEAFVKATGKGLAFPLPNFSVSVDPDGPATLLEIETDPNAVARWSLIDIRSYEGYAAAVALQKAECRIERLLWTPTARDAGIRDPAATHTGVACRADQVLL